MPKKLLLIRHAKSSWKQTELDDHDRPLNHRGKKDAPDTGNRLKQRNTLPDIIYTSTATRTVLTAKAICKVLDFSPCKIQLTPELYHASSAELIHFIKKITNQFSEVIIFGHNLGLIDLASDIWNLPILNIPTSGVIELIFEISSWQGIDRKSIQSAKFDFPKNTSEKPINLL